MSKLKRWKDIEKGFEFTPEENAEMELELEIIRATIAARKNAKLTQKELSKMSGIKQPSIAKIEKLARSPQTSTLIKLLYPMGYKLKVVPINEKD